MSLEEQQLDELNALQAIYPEEFYLIQGVDENQCAKFAITVTSNVSEEDEEEDLDICELVLEFMLPKEYPNVVPEFEITEVQNLDDMDQLEILDLLNDMAPEHIGIAMVFTLITRAFDWINELKERKILEKKQAQERKKREHDELEQKKFEGTVVTVESFIAWRIKFDAEMALLNSKKDSLKLEDQKRLTGKEMFLQDKNLIDSDLSFADSNDVEVDESLFNEDEDLIEIDEEEEGD